MWYIELSGIFMHLRCVYEPCCYNESASNVQQTVRFLPGTAMSYQMGLGGGGGQVFISGIISSAGL